MFVEVMLRVVHHRALVLAGLGAVNYVTLPSLSRGSTSNW